MLSRKAKKECIILLRKLTKNQAVGMVSGILLLDKHSLATEGITRLKGPDHEIFVAEFF